MLISQSAPAFAMITAPASQPRHALKFLVVEDNEEHRNLLALHLQHAYPAMQVTFVQSPREMVTALRVQRFDAVISDYRLPHFSADEALDIVKALPDPPPFILVSSAIGEEALINAMRRGVTDFVSKSHLSRLAPAIERVLHGEQLKQQSRAMQDALAASEERFRTLTAIAPVGILLTDADGTIVYANKRWSDILGYAEDAVLGRTWQSLLGAGESSDLPDHSEWRIHRPDGSVVWLLGRIVSQFDRSGRILGQVCAMTDISDRKASELKLLQSQDNLRRLARHLLEVEENLRASISREVHDDLGSALVGMRLMTVHLRSKISDPQMLASLEDFERQIVQANATTSRIARNLRPAALDGGLVAGIEWLVAEFIRRSGIEALFEAHCDPELDVSQALVVFRVVQEALTNVVKHAQATRVDVTLFETEDELTVEIRDNGHGLPQGVAEREGALGLVGMRERIHALGGWMDISGQPGTGVTVMFGIKLAQLAEHH